MDNSGRVTKAENNLMSFAQFQESLLKKGMAIAVDCSESLGDIIINTTVKTPLCDLHTTVQKIALEVLSDRFQKSNKFVQGQKSDDQYLEFLVSQFEEAQAEWQYLNYRSLEWLDNNDPRNGIIFKSRKDIFYYFDLVIMPARIMAFWEGELTIEVDEKTNKNVRKEIQEYLEEAEVGGDLDLFSQEFFSSIISCGFSSPKKHRTFVSSYLANVLSPILDQYKEYDLYVASGDTCYPCIVRGDFYPIIAGERLDGSHEVTIFKGTNT